MSIKKKLKPGPVNIRFKEMLDVLKEKFGHSRVRIAANLSIDRAALTHLVSGRTKAPSMQTVTMLYQAYAVNPNYIRDGSTGMFDPLVVEGNQPAQKGALAGMTVGSLVEGDRKNPAKISERIDPLEARVKSLEQLAAGHIELFSLLQKVNQGDTRRIEQLEKAVESLTKGG